MCGGGERRASRRSGSVPSAVRPSACLSVQRHGTPISVLSVLHVHMWEMPCVLVFYPINRAVYYGCVFKVLRKIFRYVSHWEGTVRIARFCKYYCRCINYVFAWFGAQLTTNQILNGCQLGFRMAAWQPFTWKQEHKYNFPEIFSLSFPWFLCWI